MLSYGASNVSNRLRRAKSSSSTQTACYTPIEPQSIVPAIARQHAVTAASLALERANERALAMQDAQEQCPWQTSPSTLRAENEQYLGKMKSIRYTGPTAVSSTDRPITRRVAVDTIASHDSSADLECAQKGLDDQATGRSEGFIRALSVVEGDCPGTRVSSVPSSYRRLRKAKSMFNPRGDRPVVFTNGTPKKGLQLNRQAARSPAPRLHRSFSFVRGKSDEMDPIAGKSVIQDTAIQIARDNYFHQVEHQKLQGQPSFSVLGKHRKPQKAFRKTVRSSSNNSDGSVAALVVPQSAGAMVSAVPAVPQSGEHSNKKRIGHKARIFSSSLKNKLKRVFHRPSDANENLPMQQVDACRPHFGDYMSTFSGVDQQYHHIASPDPETLRKARSREYIFRDGPVFVEKASRPGSIRSVRSDDDLSNGKSRVTSWTDSTAANTMNSNQAKEKKRLSIIQEHGAPYQPSSTRYHGDLGHTSCQPASEKSENQTVNGVDSQRIYSALQRIMNENKRLAHSEGNSSNVEMGADMAQIRSSSTERVTLSSRLISNTSTDSLSKRYDIISSAPIVFNPDNGFNPASENTTGQTDKQELFDERSGLTPQQVADFNEFNENGYQPPKRPLREVKSTFFPSTTRIERSNTSPYRRAMNTNNEDRNETDREIAAVAYAKAEELPPRRITPNRTRARIVGGTESVYSRTSSGHTPKPNSSTLSLAMSAGSVEPGSAVIITTRARKYEPSRSPFRQPRSSSARSSGTWQKWMASQVAHLETYVDEKNRVLGVNSDQEIGHKRERAHIDGDDIHFDRLYNFSQNPKQPLGIIQGNAVSQPAIKRCDSFPMVERYPLLNIDHLAQPNVPEPDPITPKAQSVASSGRGFRADLENCSGRKYSVSKVLRPKTLSGSLESLTSSSVPRQGLPMGSEDIKMQTSDGRHSLLLHGLAPAKHMDKTQRLYSPERIARLRRKRSTNGPAPEYPLNPEREVANDKLLQENQVIDECTFLGIPKGEHKGADGMAAGLHDSTQGGSPASRTMVDIFLSNRRRHMSIAEEDGTDPAFL